MAGKNGMGISYSTQEVELMLNAFGTLVAACTTQFDGLVKKYVAVGDSNEPFEDCPQKQPFMDILAQIKSTSEKVNERVNQASSDLKKYTDAYEQALTVNLNIAQQAAQAVAQTAAKASERQ